MLINLDNTAVSDNDRCIGDTMARVKMQKLKASKMAQQAIDRVARLIEMFGPRLVGDEATDRTSDSLHEELSSSCDSVYKEQFEVHPDAFLGWIRLMVLSYPVAVVMLWLSQPYLSLILLCGGIGIMVTEFFSYRETIDRFYERKTGTNIYGVIEPQEEVLQTVIYSGHHDSAKVFSLFVNNRQTYLPKVISALLSYAFLTLLSLIETFRQLFQGTFFSFGSVPAVILVLYILGTAATYAVSLLWFFEGKEGSPGAGDNLIASSIGVELASYFRQKRMQGEALKHTRVIIASFDGEEAGLRGSRDFFSRHIDDLCSGKTYHFNVDCLYDRSHMTFLTSDQNNRVPLSQQMATDCVNIAKSMGYEAKSRKIAFLTGATDAAESAKRGIEATTLIAMPWNNSERSEVYHTPDDTVEQIDEVAVEQTVSIAIRFIERLDTD